MSIAWCPPESLARSHPLGPLAGQLLPAQSVLRKVFRGKFVAALRQAFQNGELRFPENLKLLSEPKIFAAWLRHCFDKTGSST